ncbi:MAG: hypothetical protein HC915_12335 [Anaerolineae bacterium]|nr:hypothetical protein [Anaerolineae bacterium]
MDATLAFALLSLGLFAGVVATSIAYAAVVRPRLLAMTAPQPDPSPPLEALTEQVNALQQLIRDAQAQPVTLPDALCRCIPNNAKACANCITKQSKSCSSWPPCTHHFRSYPQRRASLLGVWSACNKGWKQRMREFKACHNK